MINGSRTELGVLLAARLGKRGGGVHFNLSGQQANTLLHDGHAWKGFARSALAGTRRAVREAAARGAKILVHASFSFVRGKPAKDPLHAIAKIILDCEAIALGGRTPACVVRLGYLYGPRSRDLAAYRDAFGRGRPYWSGPRDSRQDHLHQHDAVSSLLAAAMARNDGSILYATDGHPMAFMQLMDHFARRCSRRFPLHVPSISKPLMKLIVREEHMQQVALCVPSRSPSPQVPGWRPEYPDFRNGLESVIAAWND